MGILVVPTFSDPSYVQNTHFEGASYVLQFDYNQRAASWYLSIADAGGVDIYNGIKLMVGVPLLRKCSDVRRPPGELFVMSSTADTTPPDQLELLPGSGRCQLLYVTSDWTALLQAGNGSPLPGTALTQAGSPTVSFSKPQVIPLGLPLIFASQPGVPYNLVAAVSGTTATITPAYSGPGSGDDSVTLVAPGGVSQVAQLLLATSQAGNSPVQSSSYGQQ